MTQITQINRAKKIELLRDHYPQFEPALLEEIADASSYMEADADESLIKPGQFIKSIPLLLEGSIKILRPDGEGEELFLYHVDHGNTCTMTISCCMGMTKSEIHAVSETPVKLLMIPINKMEQWSSEFKTWRNFVFDSYHHRMMEMLSSIDSIAFQDMEGRLHRYLEEKADLTKNRNLEITHKQIASDLHTSRVVISRILKKMEKKGKIELHRNVIALA